jgi:hypothetical protein
MAESRRPIDVYLRDTVTGDTRVHRDEGWWDVDGFTEQIAFSDFIWSDGNYACDCNRSLFLWPDRTDKELPCSNDARIVIDKIVDVVTGETVYSEKAS